MIVRKNTTIQIILVILQVIRATGDTTIMGLLDDSDHISGSPDTPGHIEFKYEVGLKKFADSVSNLGEVAMERHLPARVHVRTQSAMSCIPTAFLVEVCISSKSSNQSLHVCLGYNVF